MGSIKSIGMGNEFKIFVFAPHFYAISRTHSRLQSNEIRMQGNNNCRYREHFLHI